MWFQNSPVILPTLVIHVSYNSMITNTHTDTHKCTDTHLLATKSLDSALSAWFSQKHGVTVLQYPKIPAGSLGTRSSSSLNALPGEWQGVTQWWGQRVGREEIDWRPILKMEKYPHLPQLPLRKTKMHLHTHSWESNSDGQFCHQWLPSCHSDMKRLGPYERLCSPKRCLWELERCDICCLWGVVIRCESLSCMLTGSIVVKSTARCNADAVFQQVILRRWKEIGNTLATPDGFEFQVQGSWTHLNQTEGLKMLIMHEDYHRSGWVMEARREEATL